MIIPEIIATSGKTVKKRQIEKREKKQARRPTLF
jgi:hypothetical protein